MAEKVKLDPAKYPEVYELAKAGLSDRELADRLKIKKMTFRRMKERDPVLNEIVLQGRKQSLPHYKNSYQEYVYNKLDPRAQKHWDRIMKAWTSKDKTTRRAALVEAIDGVRDASKNVRQGLFVHALIKTGFDGSKACEITGVPYSTYKSWEKYDPHFQHLLEELDWHRENFLESSFYKLVKRGNSAAILHGVKTKLAHRGYGTKVEFTGKMTHEHEDKISFEDLNLDLETQKKLLKAYEQKEKQKALPAHDPNVQDAEIVSIKPAKKRRK